MFVCYRISLSFLEELTLKDYGESFHKCPKVFHLRKFVNVERLECAFTQCKESV